MYLVADIIDCKKMMRFHESFVTEKFDSIFINKYL